MKEIPYFIGFQCPVRHDKKGVPSTLGATQAQQDCCSSIWRTLLKFLTVFNLVNDSRLSSIYVLRSVLSARQGVQKKLLLPGWCQLLFNTSRPNGIKRRIWLSATLWYEYWQRTHRWQWNSGGQILDLKKVAEVFKSSHSSRVGRNAPLLLWANLSSTNRSEHCYMPLRATARGVAEWYKAFSKRHKNHFKKPPCHCHPWKGEGNQNKDSIDFIFLMHLQNLWWVNHKHVFFCYKLWYLIWDSLFFMGESPFMWILWSRLVKGNWWRFMPWHTFCINSRQPDPKIHWVNGCAFTSAIPTCLMSGWLLLTHRNTNVWEKELHESASSQRKLKFQWFHDSMHLNNI